MIYLQIGILILEVFLCLLLNNLLNNKSNKKNTIRHLYRITNQLFKYAYVSSHVGCTYIILFTCIINTIQEKKTNHLHTSFSYHIHIVTFPEAQKKTLNTMSTSNLAVILITDKCFHSLILTTYNPILPVITEKKHSKATQKSLVQALLIGVFL